MSGSELRNTNNAMANTNEIAITIFQPELMPTFG